MTDQISDTFEWPEEMRARAEIALKARAFNAREHGPLTTAQCVDAVLSALAPQVGKLVEALEEYMAADYDLRSVFKKVAGPGSGVASDIYDAATLRYRAARDAARAALEPWRRT